MEGKMPVNFQSTPVANTCKGRIAFYNKANLVAFIDAGESEVLTITFDGIAVGKARPAVQIPNVDVEVRPTFIASVSGDSLRVLMQYGPPGVEPPTTIYFGFGRD
jgi:hypothetical protein